MRPRTLKTVAVITGLWLVVFLAAWACRTVPGGDASVGGAELSALDSGVSTVRLSDTPLDFTARDPGRMGAGIICPVPGSCIGPGVPVGQLVPGHGGQVLTTIADAATWVDGGTAALGVGDANLMIATGGDGGSFGPRQIQCGVITFQPGGSNSTCTTTTAAGVAALLAMNNGSSIIQIDPTFNTSAVIPNGVTWAMGYKGRIVGYAQALTFPKLEIQNGGLITNPSIFENVAVQCDSTGSPCFTYSSSTVDPLLTFIDASLDMSAGATGTALTVPANGVTFNVQLKLIRGSIGTVQNKNTITLASGSSGAESGGYIVLVGLAGSSIGNATLAGDNTTGLSTIGDSTFDPVGQSTYFTGGGFAGIRYFDRVLSTGYATSYTDTVTPILDASTAQAAIDRLKGNPRSVACAGRGIACSESATNAVTVTGSGLTGVSCTGDGITCSTTFDGGVSIHVPDSGAVLAPGTAGQIPITNSGATAVVQTTMSGDTTITSTGVTTTSGLQNAKLGMSGTTGLITLNQGLTAPGITQTALTSLGTPSNFTMTPQAPNGASGTAAQNTPASFQLVEPAPGLVGATGNEGGYLLTRAGTSIVDIIGLPGYAGYGSIYLGGSVAAPTPSNAAIWGDPTGLITTLNASTTLSLRVANSQAAYASLVSSALSLTATNNFFAGGGVALGVTTGGNATFGGGAAGTIAIAKDGMNPTLAPTTAGVIVYSDHTTGALTAWSNVKDLDVIQPVTSGTLNTQVLVWGRGNRCGGRTVGTSPTTVVCNIAIPGSSVCKIDLVMMARCVATTGGTCTTGDSWTSSLIGESVKNVAGTAGALSTPGTPTAVTGTDVSQSANSCAATFSGANQVITCTAATTNGTVDWSIYAEQESCN